MSTTSTSTAYDSTVSATFSDTKVSVLLELIRKRPMTSQVLEKVTQALPRNVQCSGYAGAVVGSGSTCDASAAITSWKDELGQEYNPYQYSFMGGGKNRFHPGADFFYLPTAHKEIKWIKGKVPSFAGTLPDAVTTPAEWKEVHSCLKMVMDIVGATGVSHYIKTTNKAEATRVAENVVKQSHKARAKALGEAKKARAAGKVHIYSMPPHVRAPKINRETCRGELVLSQPSVNATCKSTLFKNLFFGDYKRALKFTSEFAGRVHEWSDSWVTAHSLRIAKVGLVDAALDTYAEELKSLPVTASFLALAVAEFGARKEFTLESQKQGALNPHLQILLRVIKNREPSGLKLIAYILPSEEIFREVYALSPEVILDIHSKWTEWMGVFALFLDSEWKKGVGKSSRREMRVLPRGSHVNSTGWNSVADAWQNGCRFLRLTAIVCGIQGQPLYLKVLQLIANDQFQWGEEAEKKMDPNVAVFHDITTQGFLPWNAVLYPERFDNVRIVTALAESCTTHACSLGGWLGVPKIRTEDTVRVHVDMICGCKVLPMSSECAEFLTFLGIFGSNEWDGK